MCVTKSELQTTIFAVLSLFTKYQIFHLSKMMCHFFFSRQNWNRIPHPTKKVKTFWGCAIFSLEFKLIFFSTRSFSNVCLFCSWWKKKEFSLSATEEKKMWQIHLQFVPFSLLVHSLKSNTNIKEIEATLHQILLNHKN